LGQKDKKLNYIAAFLSFIIFGAVLIVGQLFIDDERPESKWNVSGHAQKLKMVFGGCALIIMGIIILLIGR